MSARFSGASLETKIMKRIEAVVRHHKLEDVKNDLTAAGVEGMTVSEVHGFGRQRGQKEIYRGTEHSVDFVPKARIEVIVPDSVARVVVDTIIRAAQTGGVGDGKIFVSNIQEVIRIRTGEVGAIAL